VIGFGGRQRGKNTKSKKEGGEKIRNEKYIHIYYNNDERFPCTDGLSISRSKP